MGKSSELRPNLPIIVACTRKKAAKQGRGERERVDNVFLLDLQHLK